WKWRGWRWRKRRGGVQEGDGRCGRWCGGHRWWSRRANKSTSCCWRKGKRRSSTRSTAGREKKRSSIVRDGRHGRGERRGASWMWSSGRETQDKSGWSLGVFTVRVPERV